ncbi:MAG: hypothetical protein LBH25_00235 [Fibromonadaceae bacterium]|jgi:hypothetical protein|nr:hypothetical protein [Fibromonadaceae bacterium]
MTVAFQAKVENNAIAIPDIYRELVMDKALVTVSFEERKERITKDNFKPFINTEGWKFNREEANER